MVSGVAGGLAAYFEVDVTLLRLLWVVAALVAPPVALAAYVAALLLIPEAPGARADRQTTAAPAPDGTADDGAEGERHSPEPVGTPIRQVIGYSLVIAGVYFLLRQFIPRQFWMRFWWFTPDRLWPLAIVIVGVLILVRGRRG
jgi:phage shock protein PspC (stress-responsive transcriptional regulator)